MFDLNHIFTYHAPSAAQLDDYAAIRDAGRELARVIQERCPTGADSADAIRKVREAVMTANAAVALAGRLTF